MDLCSIASGSNGNCIYVGDGHTHILVDVGISRKRIVEGLHSCELDGEDIDAILITHEHSDHIQGLGVFSRKYGVPVYATAGTLNAIAARDLGPLPEGMFHEVAEDIAFNIGELEVLPLSTSHDAAQPVCYRLSSGTQTIAVVTDLGVTDDYLVKGLGQLDGMILESNHDIRMLEEGPYPRYLKERIAGKHGHLSNKAAGELLCRLLNGRMQHVMLGHLSAHNNQPDLACETVRTVVTQDACAWKGDDLPLIPANRTGASALLEI